MWGKAVDFFTKSLENDGRNAGLRLEQTGRTEGIESNNISRSPNQFGDILRDFAQAGARLVFVVMVDECYADVKFYADRQG